MRKGLKVEKAALQPSGIEPETSAWKAKSLPLAYGCFCESNQVFLGPPFIKNGIPLNCFQNKIYIRKPA